MIRKGMAALAAASLLSAGAFAQLYSTSFEAPTYTAGSSVHGVDGWNNGSGGGLSQRVSTAAAASGSQSLFWDNNTSTGFYSVRRTLPSLGSLPVNISVMLHIQGNTQMNRLYGIYLSSSATGTLGTTVFGMTLGGDGTVRAGKTWGNTYQASGVIANVPTSSFYDRWVKLTLTYEPGTGNGSVRLSNLFGAGDVTSNYTGITNPLGLNLGSDYVTSVNQRGTAFMDDLVIAAVPEPATLAALGLGALAMLRRRRK
jgi:hypothetical protein